MIDIDMNNMTAIKIIIYLIGIPLGYLSMKNFVSESGKLGWTVGDRCLAMGFSLFSWASVLTGLICKLITTRNDKPAKW